MPASPKLPTLNLSKKIQMETMGADLSATSIFNNEGHGFENPITMRNIMTNYVYPDGLALSEISGKDLKQALEQTATILFFQIIKSWSTRLTIRPNCGTIIMTCTKAWTTRSTLLNPWAIESKTSPIKAARLRIRNTSPSL
ncbi:5'-nucleotidase C-terminal domain-containing protein [Secundilactobacillus kimchicus]|uniref:5'-nucleotidase C-terminal domain-containing protein n=1 Tax=Secundilactobacillus kimchicus TaxID=528209 RepID=UPI003F73D0AB